MTNFLILYSFTTGLHKWGFAVYFLNDLSEIFVNFGRLFNEIEQTKDIPVLISFTATIISWFYGRIYSYFIEVLVIGIK